MSARRGRHGGSFGGTAGGGAGIVPAGMLLVLLAVHDGGKRFPVPGLLPHFKGARVDAAPLRAVGAAKAEAPSAAKQKRK